MKQLMSIVMVGLVGSMGVVSSVDGQTLPPEQRFFVSIDGGFQNGSQQLQDRRVTEDVYGEDQITDTDYNIDRSGGLFRANVAAKIWRSFGAGFGFTRSTGTGTANVTAAVPHPIFVARPRIVSTDLMNLGHRASMFHFQAVWMLPLDDRAQLQLFAGPTVMSVDQAFVMNAIAVEVGSPFSDVRLADVEVEELSEGGLGFNVGLDFSYMLGDMYGLGGFVQYAGGSVDFATGATTTSVKVGGLQVGGGLRLRF